ncbi:hypothetical protein Nepgr_020338 [Nepenthes gracilis]|uniref:Uncharacterized protein n=1 Tax=Nepenthes gracilis TaxID=150966 RepID=A0AAD3SXY6_NEPGR|nr:hypothetical protein Nepgr_020338 [Nepenthes gracilis]
MSHSWKLMRLPLNGPAVLTLALWMHLLDWKGYYVLVQFCAEELPRPQEQHFEAMMEYVVVLLQFAFSGADGMPLFLLRCGIDCGCLLIVVVPLPDECVPINVTSSSSFGSEVISNLPPLPAPLNSAVQPSWAAIVSKNDVAAGLIAFALLYPLPRPWWVELIGKNLAKSNGNPRERCSPFSLASLFALAFGGCRSCLYAAAISSSTTAGVVKSHPSRPVFLLSFESDSRSSLKSSNPSLLLKIVRFAYSSESRRSVFLSRPFYSPCFFLSNLFLPWFLTASADKPHPFLSLSPSFRSTRIHSPLKSTCSFCYVWKNLPFFQI